MDMDVDMDVGIDMGELICHICVVYFAMAMCMHMGTKSCMDIYVNAMHMQCVRCM